MLKFLGRIQFSIEMTMWLIVYVALLGILKSSTEYAYSLAGAKVPTLTSFFWNPAQWIRWWMVPITICVLIVIEWKFSIPKWLQWAIRLFQFTLILLTILAGEFAWHAFCGQKSCSA